MGGGESREIPLVASCYRNRDELWPDQSLGSYANFNFTFIHVQIQSTGFKTIALTCRLISKNNFKICQGYKYFSINVLNHVKSHVNKQGENTTSSSQETGIMKIVYSKF